LRCHHKPVQLFSSSTLPGANSWRVRRFCSGWPLSP
jgi:hypothetical protein